MSCPDCFRGGKATGEPKGSMIDFAGVPTYVAGSPSITKSDSTIIYYTDAFGLKLLNSKILADDYANATGFRVLVPDIIPGGGMTPDVMPLMDKVMAPVPLFNLWGQISRVANAVRVLVHFIPFTIRASPKKTFDACLDYARKIRADLPPGAKLGVAGFCWGGFQSLTLCKHASREGGSERLIDAQFTAHPSALRMPADVVEAVTKFRTPVAIAHAENDFVLPTKKLEEAEAELRQRAGNGEGENGYWYQIEHYAGVGHGFAVRAKPGNEKEADAADRAKKQAIDWFLKWL